MPSGTFYWTGYHESSCVRLKINLTNFSRTVHTKRVFFITEIVSWSFDDCFSTSTRHDTFTGGSMS